MAAVAAQTGGSAYATLAAPSASQRTLLDLPATEGPLPVRAEFHLLDIQKTFDETEPFAFSGVLTLTWQDYRQRFDPMIERVEEIVYSGNYQFNELPPVWYPQVILADAAQVNEAQGVLVRVSPDGSSRLVQPINAIARSALNLHRYPFDRQRLETVFVSIGVRAVIG